MFRALAWTLLTPICLSSVVIKMLPSISPKATNARSYSGHTQLGQRRFIGAVGLHRVSDSVCNFLHGALVLVHRQDLMAQIAECSCQIAAESSQADDRDVHVTAMSGGGVASRGMLLLWHLV